MTLYSRPTTLAAFSVVYSLFDMAKGALYAFMTTSGETIMNVSKLSREELYELVWSTPMMHAAKQFGISGVMLGKTCRDRQVPRPPRGYWAKLQSKKRRDQCIKPPLPNLPAPVQNFDRFLLDEHERQRAPRPDDFDPNDLTEPIPSPPEKFKDTLKDYQAHIESNFPVLLEPSQITSLHPIVQKVLAADLLIAAARKRDRYGDEPRFQSEKGKLHLHLLNTFINLFESLGFTVSVSGKKNFRFFVSLSVHSREFHVFLREYDPSLYSRKYLKEKKRTTFCFSWTNEGEYVTAGQKYYEFEELNADCVKKVVVHMAVKDEDQYRRSVFRKYDDRIENRREAIKRQAYLEQQAAEKKRRALALLLANRIDLMNMAVRDMNHADQIRSLIAKVQEKSAQTKNPIDGLSRWVGWAANHANDIDLRYMSVKGLEAWIKKFQLRN